MIPWLIQYKGLPPLTSFLLTDSVSSTNEASTVAEIDIAKIYLTTFKTCFKNCLRNVPLRKYQFKVNVVKLSLVVGLLFDGLTFFT